MIRKHRIRSAFARAAAYDDSARVQRIVATELARRIARLHLPPSPEILEIGCGTGFLTEALLPFMREGRWTITDIAPEMVERAKAKLGDRPHLFFAVMDGEMPDRGQHYDLICSSLAAQWFEDLPEAIPRLTGLLKPGGHLAFTTLGPDSFIEWRAAHERFSIEPGTPSFLPPSRIAEACPQGIDCTTDKDVLVDSYGNGRAFLSALKAIGAATPRGGRAPLRPSDLRRVLAEFEARGAQVSYEVVTAIFTRRGG